MSHSALPVAVPAARLLNSLPRLSETAFALVATAAYAVLLVLGLWQHEIWRDEAHIWILGRHCANLRELLYHLHLDAHGPIWQVLNYAASRFTSWPPTMQVIHGLLALVHVYVVMRLAPWARWQRLLYAVGYYTLFEYGMLSRDYLWIVPLLLLFIHHALRRPAATWLGFGLLALGTLSNIYAIILVLAMLPLYGYHLWRSGLLGTTGGRLHVAGGLGLTLGAVAFTLWVMLPPPGRELFLVDPWQFGWNSTHASALLQWYFAGLCPLPPPILEFWNVSRVSSPLLRLLLGVGLLLWIGWLLRDRLPALAVWAMGNAGIMSFSYCKYIGTTRHFGYLYIVLVAAWWVAAQPPAWYAPAADGWRARCRGYTLTALLLLQAIAGLFAWTADLMLPFSGSKAAAAQITALRLPEYELVGDPPYWVDGILFYLDHDIWLPAKRSHGYWSEYDRTLYAVTPESLLRDAITVSRNAQHPAILVVASPVGDTLLEQLPPDVSVTLAGKPVPCIQSQESFWVYLVQTGVTPGTAAPAAPPTTAAPVP